MVVFRKNKPQDTALIKSSCESHLLMCPWPKQVTWPSSAPLWKGTAQAYGYWGAWFTGAISLTIYHKISIQFIHQIFPGHLLCATHFARRPGTVVNKADMILALIHTSGRETVSKQWQMGSELLRSSGCCGNLQQGKTHPRDQERRPWEMMLKLRRKEWAGISYIKGGGG